MLDLLKNFNADRMEIDELVELAMFGDQILAKFKELGVETPVWIDEANKSVKRELKTKNADRLSMKLRSAKSRLETLKTPDEKRKATEAEIAELEAQLAGQ